jgi:hypothetical protein
MTHKKENLSNNSALSMIHMPNPNLKPCPNYMKYPTAWPTIHKTSALSVKQDMEMPITKQLMVTVIFKRDLLLVLLLIV